MFLRKWQQDRETEREREGREKEGEKRAKGEVMSVLLRQVVAVNCSPGRPVKPIKILGKTQNVYKNVT